jgi:hypothetical protein
VFPGARLERHVFRLCVRVSHPSLRASTPIAYMQPSYSVSHPVGAAHRALCGARSSAIGFAILSERFSKSWELKGYIHAEGALDTRWCHYQTLAPSQKGEEPAPGDENDREKGHAPTSG